MESKLSFDEVQLNYILEAVQYFRERMPVALSFDRAVYTAELENIEERILHFLDGEVQSQP
jgi:hypothetical protein